MPFATNLRRNIFRAFWAISVVLILYIGIGLYQAGGQHVRETKANLERGAATVANVIESTLIDASKVLDVTRTRLELEIRHGGLTPETAHDTLSNAIGDFSLHKTSDFFGLIAVLDSNGHLLALNSGTGYQGLNYSDDYFFKVLKENPDRRLAVGNLLVSKVNAKKVFHLAMPLKDQGGKFAGVVALQIVASDLSKALDGMLEKNGDRTYVFASNEKITYVYSQSEQPNAGSEIDSHRLINLVEAEDDLTGSFKVSGQEINQPYDMYAGYERLPKFGIYTVTLISAPLVWKNTLVSNQVTLGLGLLLFLLTSWLFIKLYRQAINLEVAEFASMHDPLTGLNNRRALDEIFARLWRESMREQKPISVLFIDIDLLKRVNDTYGHDIGDQVIKSVGQAITESLLRPLDLSCRWGGEEFVAILPRTAEPDAIKVAERIMNAVRALKITQKGVDIGQITVSVGIASTTVNAYNLHDDLIDMADKAMLQAKAEGRDRWVIYSM